MKIWEDGQTITANDINLILQRLPLSVFYWYADEMTSEEIQENAQILNTLFATLHGEDITTYEYNETDVHFYKIEANLQQIFDSFQANQKPINWNTCIIIKSSSSNGYNFKYNSNLFKNLFGVTQEQIFISPYVYDETNDKLILNNQFFNNNCNSYRMSAQDSYHIKGRNVLHDSQYAMRTTGLNDPIYYVELLQKEQAPTSEPE